MAIQNSKMGASQLATCPLEILFVSSKPSSLNHASPPDRLYENKINK